MTRRSIAVRYGEATRSFIELARSLDADDWSVEVPCTPLWTVRDVLSHVAGIPDDGIAGRTDGAATEPWTASQIERNAVFTVDELLDRWEQQCELFGAAIESMGEERPPFDCHAHEHDVRHALNRPGNRDSAIIDDAVPRLLASLAQVPVALVVHLDDGASVDVGAGGPPIELTTSRFEVFRSMLGRRTVDQVRGLAWTGDAAAIDLAVDGWFTFGPSDRPIQE